MSVVTPAFKQFGERKRPGFSRRSRETSVGASEIGQCERKIGYEKHDADQDEEFIRTWGAAQRGISIEKSFFVPAMKKFYGENFIAAGSKQKRLVDGNLSATPDALLVNQPRNLLAGLMVPDIGPSGCVAVECKTVDPRVNLSKPKPEHIFQVVVQLGLLRKLTEYQPDYALLSYINASFLDDVVEFVIEFDEAVFAEAYKRADKIINATAAAQLKPEGWIAGGGSESGECKYCPYATACRALRGDIPLGIDKLGFNDPQFIAEVTDLAYQERERHAAVKEADALHREAQEKIKERMRERSLRTLKTSDINVVWSTVKGRPSYDWPGIRAAVAEAGLDLSPYETTGEPSDRLSVTVTKRDRLVTKRAS